MSNDEKDTTKARVKRAITDRKKTTKEETAEAPQPETLDRAAVIERAISALEKQLSADTVRGSVTDFIRLLQLQKELGGDEPREVTVTWIYPTEDGSFEE